MSKYPNARQNNQPPLEHGDGKHKKTPKNDLQNVSAIRVEPTEYQKISRIMKAFERLAQPIGPRVAKEKTAQNKQNLHHNTQGQRQSMCLESKEAHSSLTKKAEPPPTRDVNRDSGTASANGGWLRRFVRRHFPIRHFHNQSPVTDIAAINVHHHPNHASSKTTANANQR